MITILPLVTGGGYSACTICGQDAQRAVVTDDSCPVIEALCIACAKSATAFTNPTDGWTWLEVADAIRDERSGVEPDEPDESMDGDHETALRDAGFGTDEDYGHFGGGEE